MVESETGQSSETAMAGCVVIGQVAEAVFVTPAPVQTLLPLARTPVVAEQTFIGAVKLPE